MTWWKQAVFYEIYIRSFQDSGSDGIGDLQGIIQRVDYLADLGIDGIWITPFYPSPQVDFGYDVVDHEDVDPAFGALADFDRLVAAAHDRRIKIVVDIVLNHTSDRHPWFLSSRASRSSTVRDWYIWRDGRPGGGPPNNWESAFGGPAWTFDEKTGQWYYHCFYPEQPDLNWRNPAVEQRMFEAVKFWIDRGVDGFRLDAANTLFEDEALRDNPPLASPRITLTGVRSQEQVYTRHLPEVHDVLKRLRRFVDQCAPDTVLISEAYVDKAEDLVNFYGEEDDEMHLPFNFLMAQVAQLDAKAFKTAVEQVERVFGERWPSLVLSNHDIDRACDRYRASTTDDEVAKLLAVLLLTLRGTPFLYYGEEIAMRTEPPKDLDEVRDPVGRRFWPGYKGRDGVRRPLPWDRSVHGGFSRGTPWLALAVDAGRRNVASQREDAGSVLNLYRHLLHLRRTSPALSTGRYRSIVSKPDVFAYLRESAGDIRLVALNMSDRACEDALRGSGESPNQGIDLQRHEWRVAAATHRHQGLRIDPHALNLNPFEALLLEPFPPG